MGIDIAAFEFLLRSHKECGDFGTTLILGRQRMLTHGDQYVKSSKILAKYQPNITMENIQHDYVDKLIECLGGNPVHYLDNSSYEGAQVIHDLNEPIPEKLHEKYDTVIDIGALEHVFNIGVAMKSMAEIVRVGGQFLCLNVANHHLGHGFWQLGPEVFFRTFSDVQGFEPLIADIYYHGAFHPLRDPEIAGRRLPIKTLGYTYILFTARKTIHCNVFSNGWPIQADYRAAWIKFLARRAVNEGNTIKAESILKDAITRYPNNPLYLVELSRLLRNLNQDISEIDSLSARAIKLADDNNIVIEERKAVLKHLARVGTISEA